MLAFRSWHLELPHLSHGKAMDIGIEGGKGAYIVGANIQEGNNYSAVRLHSGQRGERRTLPILVPRAQLFPIENEPNIILALFLLYFFKEGSDSHMKRNVV